MNIPFVDLERQHSPLQDDLDEAIQRVFDTSAFVGRRNNKFVTEFENQWGTYLGSKHVVGCGNGTDALEMTLEAAGVQRGDEVIVPAMTWIATASSVLRCGATPVFVDVHPDYYTIRTDLIEQRITEQTKAIIPVHLYGLPADMDPLMQIAERHNLLVIEDAAQAHGAKYKGISAGTLAHAAVFSFFPGKNLGSIGDAGCVVTNDSALAEEVRRIANHGQVRKHDHQRLGRNSRLDGIAAAVLSVKLRHLDRWNAERARVANEYGRLLADAGMKLPTYPEYALSSYHLYVVTAQSSAAQTALGALQYPRHYPTKLWEQPMFAAAHRSETYPTAEALSTIGYSLPVFPGMTQDEIEMVVEKVESGLMAYENDRR